MSWVVIRPARIGDRVREVGDVLTNDDLKGRDTRRMEEIEKCIRWVDDTPARKPASGRSRKPASDSDDE